MEMYHSQANQGQSDSFYFIVSAFISQIHSMNLKLNICPKSVVPNVEDHKLIVNMKEKTLLTLNSIRSCFTFKVPCNILVTLLKYNILRRFLTNCKKCRRQTRFTFRESTAKLPKL